MHLILPLDVAERAFSRCVTTNKGKGSSWEEEVHADSRKLEVKFNYEFLEDFQNEQSSGEEGQTITDTRYPQSAQIFLSPLVIVIFCSTALIPGSRRNLQSTVTHFF